MLNNMAKNNAYIFVKVSRYTSNQMCIWTKRFRFVHEINTFCITFSAINGSQRSLSMHILQSKVKPDSCSIGRQTETITQNHHNATQNTNGCHSDVRVTTRIMLRYLYSVILSYKTHNSWLFVFFNI